MTADFFTYNRHNVCSAVDGGVVVVAAHTAVQRRADASFQFEQESNFWYLTGVDAADWWLISDGSRHKSWLVAPDISEAHQVFDGSLSREVAQQLSGVDAVIGAAEAEELLRDLAKRHSVVHTIGPDAHAKHYDFSLNPGPVQMHRRLERLFGEVRDCRRDIAILRARKQSVEIAAMKQAIEVTVGAFEQVKQELPRLGYEYQVEAEFSHHLRSHGATGHAYDPIVASGKNACTLHYVDNQAKLSRKNLLLLDVGARHCGYAADITRTYALGTPTRRQREVHAAVQQAMQQIIALVGPDLRVEEYQSRVDDVMKQAVLSLGLMKDLSDEEAYRRYFPHAISHGLGIDVHDSLGGTSTLQAGMVLTVEPGIYIPEEGIGIRLEDDILVTAHGYENLTKQLSTDIA